MLHLQVTEHLLCSLSSLGSTLTRTSTIVGLSKIISQVNETPLEHYSSGMNNLEPKLSNLEKVEQTSSMASVKIINIIRMSKFNFITKVIKNSRKNQKDIRKNA